MNRSRRKTPIADYQGSNLKKRASPLLRKMESRINTPSIETLASAWARIVEEAGFPFDYEGTASPEAHQASETIQERIREHIVTTNDMRLFSLLHLLGQASLLMEQALWPKNYEHMTREIEQALREADNLDANSCPHKKS